MIGITGATGHLGRLVVDALLEGGTTPAAIVALARSPERAAELEAKGVQVRRADYEVPETLGPALAGVGRLLLISSNQVGRRAAQHRNVVEAAKEAGVGMIAYTSLLNAGTSRMQLAVEHRETEEALAASGIPHVLLRNGWYVENYTDNLAPVLEHGALLGSAGEGRVSAATRADFAGAAAVVIRAEGHEGAVYELGGDTAFTMSELAEAISTATGRTIVYRDLSPDDYAQTLMAAGMPEPFARLMADSDQGVARGELETGSDDLRRLLGRPTTTLAEALRARF